MPDLFILSWKFGATFALANETVAARAEMAIRLVMFFMCFFVVFLLVGRGMPEAEVRVLGLLLSSELRG